MRGPEAKLRYKWKNAFTAHCAEWLASPQTLHSTIMLERLDTSPRPLALTLLELELVLREHRGVSTWGH